MKQSSPMFFKNDSTVDSMSSYSVEINLHLMRTRGRLSFASSLTTKFIPLVQPRGLATTVVGVGTLSVLCRQGCACGCLNHRAWLPRPQSLAKNTQVAQLCDFERLSQMQTLTTSDRLRELFELETAAREKVVLQISTVAIT